MQYPMNFATSLVSISGCRNLIPLPDFPTSLFARMQYTRRLYSCQLYKTSTRFFLNGYINKMAFRIASERHLVLHWK